MKTICILFIGVALSLLAAQFTPVDTDTGLTATENGDNNTPPEPQPVPESTPSETTPAPRPAADTPPPPPTPIPTWEVQQPVNGVAPEHINHALTVYKNMGLSKIGAAYLIGNFAQESPGAFTDPCVQYGDGGLALGFGQWHPLRRVDMPCDVTKQLQWAVDVEMPRDAADMGYTSLSEHLRGNDVTAITHGLQQWERYGHEGKRYQYGQQIYNAIK